MFRAQRGSLFGGLYALAVAPECCSERKAAQQAVDGIHAGELQLSSETPHGTGHAGIDAQHRA